MYRKGSIVLNIDRLLLKTVAPATRDKEERLFPSLSGREKVDSFLMLLRRLQFRKTVAQNALVRTFQKTLE